MSQSIGGLSHPNSVDFNALINQIGGAMQAAGGTVVPGAGETLDSLLNKFSDATLPTLEKPATTDTSKACGLTMGGLSLETLMDAVGAEQRRTETKAGIANMEARAQERADANAEKIKQVQEEVDKAKSGGFLDGLLKAFKYIGMALAAIGSVAMMVAGGVACAAGGAGVALIAVGAVSMALLVSSITEEATGGEAGFSPAFAVGKIMEACGASEAAVTWTKFAVDLATSLALVVASCGASAGSAVGNVGQAAAKGTANTIQSVASMTGRVATIAGGVNTIAQSSTSIASAVNERDMSFLQAERKRLDALLQRIANANNMDMDHIKAMMERSEAVLQQVSDIVQQGADTNTALLAGAPAMA